MKTKEKKKYYYYKKKIGRHKKPGPKKKKKMRGRRWQEPWNYKIVLCYFRKQDKYIGQYHDYDEVKIVLDALKKQNENIQFPMKYTQSRLKSVNPIETINEYVVLKRVRDNSDTTNQLRNEYGRFVDIKTTSNEWMVYERIECLKEEIFWVYGYNPRTDRKNFQWIKENLIDDIAQDKYSIVRIYIYNNKVIFKYDNNDFEFVICKNVSDAIRMYNLLFSEYKKQKNVVFTGMTSKKTERTNDIVEAIRRKTGWDYQKIYRKRTG